MYDGLHSVDEDAGFRGGYVEHLFRSGFDGR
jgi:hypothetical protein